MATKKSTGKSASHSKNLYDSLLELIRVTSTVLPDDVQKVILKGLRKEKKNTTAKYAMEIIEKNIKLAKMKSQPICQDTGTILTYVSHPPGFDQAAFEKVFKKAVVDATKKGYLRQNSVDILTEKNESLNIGLGHPSIHFHQHKKKSLEVKLMLKGGGCENVGAQYSLPNTSLDAGRDLDGLSSHLLA